jgi:hypothetical protein
MADVLRQVSANRWAGTLAGYDVAVFEVLGRWNLWIGHPKRYTLICCPVASPRDGAAVAREYVERNGPPWYPPSERPAPPRR